VLARERLGAPVVVGADTIPPRQATLAAIEGRTSKAVVGYTEHSFDLFDDIASTGYPEPAGVFGRPLKDFLTVEGNYTFHFEATYGEGCTATRELRWSLHVDVGIDPGSSSLTTSLAGDKGRSRSFRAIAMAIKWVRDWPADSLLAVYLERL